MGTGWTRRLFVGSLAALGRAEISSEKRRFRDPVTEFDLTRLSDPKLSNCVLPQAPLRPVTRRSNHLFYCSDRLGSYRIFRMDLKSGESRELAGTEGVDPAAMSSLPDDKSAVFCTGGAVAIAGSRTRAVYKLESGWARTAFAVSDDGQHAVLGEASSTQRRLRLLPLLKGSAATLVEPPTPVLFAATRPKRSALLYGREDGLWLVHYDGQGSRKLKTAPGTIPAAQWSSDGRSIQYLLVPAEEGKLHELREHTPDANEDKLLARTSQFISFARNTDGSVFVGVSASKASPYVLLLLRSARRELTLAEHASSNAKKVAVHFSPDSQRIYYHSDREGKSAIYALDVEKFVEFTDSEEATAQEG